MLWLLQGRGGGGGFNPNYVRLIVFLIIFGFSALSWVFRKLQEQAAKKRAREAIEQRELELLRTGRAPESPAQAPAPISEMPSLPAPSRPQQSDVDRRIEELRRRREAMAQRRATQSPRVDATAAPTSKPSAPPPVLRSAERPPIVFIPGSSGPIVAQRPRAARADPAPQPQLQQPAPPARAPMPTMPERPVRRPSKPGQPDRLERESAPVPVRRISPVAPRTPGDWRRAIVAREVLAPPMGLRTDDDLPRGLV